MAAEFHSSRIAKVYCERPGKKKTLAAYITLSRVPSVHSMRARPGHGGVLHGGGVQLCIYKCPMYDIKFPEFKMGLCNGLWRLITGDIPDFTGEGAQGLLNSVTGGIRILDEMLGCIEPVPNSEEEMLNAILAIYYVITGDPTVHAGLQDPAWPMNIFGNGLVRGQGASRPDHCGEIWPGRVNGTATTVPVNGPFEPYNEPGRRSTLGQVLGLGSGGPLHPGPGEQECDCLCEITYQYIAGAGDQHQGGCIELKAKTPAGSNTKCSIEIVGNRGAPISLPIILPRLPSYPKITLSNNCRWVN